jgi:tRNA A22 N-methylase
MDGQTSKCKLYVRLYDLLICVLLLSKANQHLHALQLLITPFFVKKKDAQIVPKFKATFKQHNQLSFTGRRL